MNKPERENRWGSHPSNGGFAPERFPAFTIECVDRKDSEGPGNLSSTDYRLLVADGHASVEIACAGGSQTLFAFRGREYTASVHEADDGYSYTVFPVGAGAEPSTPLPWLPFELDGVRIDQKTDFPALVARTLGGWTPAAARPADRNPARWALKLWSSLAGTDLQDEVAHAAGACLRSTDLQVRAAALRFFDRAGQVPGCEVIEEVAAASEVDPLDAVLDPTYPSSQAVPLGRSVRIALSNRILGLRDAGVHPGRALATAKQLILQQGRALGLLTAVSESDWRWFEWNAEEIVKATPESCVDVLMTFPKPDEDDPEEGTGMLAARLASIPGIDSEELLMWAESMLSEDALAEVQAALDARAPTEDRVLRNPEAEEPRIAYADAMQASDPDRAELIRVQLRLAQSRRKGLPPLDRADDYTRERVLLDRHKGTWTKHVTGIPGVQYVGFLRGFVEHVQMSAPDFLLCGEELYSRAPILHLDLVELAPHAREVFASPLLDRIHSLRLSRGQLDDNAAKALADSPHLKRLRWLDLSYNRIGQEGLEAICASTQLPSLRYLDFADNAAPDPTPKIGETDMDTNDVLSLEIPPAASALEARFGKKPWLSSELVGTMFPPERDLF